MLKISNLFLIFIASTVAKSGNISKLSDIVVKDLNGNDFSFEKFEGKCILIVNTGSDYVYSDVGLHNMEFLNNIAKYTDIQVVAFPSNTFGDEPKTNEQLKVWFFNEWEVEYPVMEKVNILENDFYKFLAKKAGGKRIVSSFGKYLIEKDFSKVTKYGPAAGAIVSEDLYEHLEICGKNKSYTSSVLDTVEETDNEVRKLAEISVEDINGKIIKLKKFEGNCILVVNTASESRISTISMEYLENLQEYYPEIKIFAFPSNAFGNEPKTNEELKLWFEKFNARYYVMAKTDILKSDFYKFLTRNARGKKINSDFAKYLIEPNGMTVTRFGPESGAFIFMGLDTHLQRCLRYRKLLE